MSASQNNVPQEAINAAEWLEFQQVGLLWWVNQMLHIFGWAIVLEMENGVVTRAFPARVPFRGFDTATSDQGYTRLTRHMVNEGDRLLKDVE